MRRCAGQALFQAQIYDGSEKGQKVYDTTAFIGKPVAAGSRCRQARSRRPRTRGLPNSPHGRCRSAISRPKGGDLTPSYQIDFRLYANGVSRELLIDYGDFSIHGTLTSLEYLKATECHRTP